MLSHKLILLLAPLAIVGTVAAAATANHLAATSQEVQCQIRATPTPGGIELATYATSETPASGSYRFTVSKNGGGSSSDVNQSGDFNARPGAHNMLGLVDLNIDRGTRYVAKLSLTWDGQATSCVKTFG
jgi:hypothetical protein